MFGRRPWKHALMVLVLVFTLGGGLVSAQQDVHEFSSAPLTMSVEEQAWVDAHKDLRLGVWLSVPPIMFRGDDGSMQGIVPAYVDIIEKKLGLTPRRIRGSGFKAVWELAKAGEVDMVPAVTAGPERSGDMLISEPYVYMPIVVVTRADFPFIAGLKDLEGRTVSVTAGHVAQLQMAKDYPEIVPLPVSTPEMGLRAVENGRADAFVGSEASVAYLSRKYGIINLRVGAVTEYSYRLSIGVRKDWPILLTLVNRALASIPEEDRKHIHDYWTVLRDSQWVERPDVWRMVGGTILAAVALVLLFFFWNRKLAAEVDKRKRAEAKIKKAHQATEQVIESADVIIVGLDYAGHVKLLNKAGEAITGYRREELLDKNWFDVVVPRERFPYVWDEFARLQREGHTSSNDTFENPILTKAGETRHILWRNSAASDEDSELTTISFGTDITNRLRAEEELRLTQFAMDNAAVGVFRIQPSARIVYANRTAAQLLGQTRAELKRKTISEVTPDLTSEDWDKFWQRLKYNQMLTFETAIRDVAGKAVPVEVTAYHLLFKGTELAIAFFSDISERKRVERLRDDVERMVRHDLRSPTLAVQTLFTMFNRADNLTDRQRELLESVENASRRMIRIIDMSRALYKMEAGSYAVNPEPVDLLPLIEGVANELRPLTRLKKVSLVVLLGGEPVGDDNVFMIDSEEILCYALLANLLKNAVEASPEGEPVTMDLNTAESHVITVHNLGVIPEKIRDTFFDKYVTSGKDQGTGLGTYTSHLITTSLGGKIHFTTSSAEGTTVSVSLPRRNESDS